MIVCVKGVAGLGAADRLEPAHVSEFCMAALIAIGAFLVAIFVLNWIEFGRPD
jgi:hypothetical protein